MEELSPYNAPLIPCPFCGESCVDPQYGLQLRHHYFAVGGEVAEDEWSVLCTSCGMETANFDTMEKAIEFWNKRSNID